MKLKVMLDAGAKMPTRAHPADAGLDLYAPDHIRIFPHSYAAIDLGVHVEIPEGYVGLITSKSGLMADGITCRGTIDSGYTGSMKAVLYNQNNRDYWIGKGQKVTQLVILPILTPDMVRVEVLTETDRGDNGFGSTGR